MQLTYSPWSKLFVAAGLIYGTAVFAAPPKLPVVKALVFHAFNDPDNYTSATDVDKSGNVVGSASGDDGSERGFIRRPDGSFIELKAVLDGVASIDTVPRAISEQGTVLGMDVWTNPDISNGTDVQPARSWLYDMSTGQYSEIKYPGSFGTQAYDMNEHGLVVGWATTSSQQPGGPAVGFKWQNGEFTTVQIPGAFSTKLVAVNEKGQMVGQFMRRADNGAVSLNQFIMQPDGSYSVVSPRSDGSPWRIWTLGNNGDYAGGCFQGGVVHDVCYHVAATGEDRLVEDYFGPPCDGLYINIESLKANLATGRCRDDDGGGSGWVTTKKNLLRYSFPD